jgi:hypothetical protein
MTDNGSQVVSLRTGEAMLFAPSGLSVRWTTDDDDSDHCDAPIQTGAIAPLGPGYLLVKSRLRITRDGGHSMLAVKGSSLNSRIGPVASRSGAEGDKGPSPAAAELGLKSALRGFAAEPKEHGPWDDARSESSSWESCASPALSPFASRSPVSDSTASASLHGAGSCKGSTST